MNIAPRNALLAPGLLVGGEMSYLNHSSKFVLRLRALGKRVSTRQQSVPSLHSRSDLRPSFRAAEEGSQNERSGELAHWKTRRQGLRLISTVAFFVRT
jgi:hypothetical protein